MSLRTHESKPTLIPVSHKSRPNVIPDQRKNGQTRIWTPDLRFQTQAQVQI